MTDTRTNRHHEVMESIPWYVNGTLPDDEATAVRDHLTHCSECAAEVQRQKRILGAVREGSATPIVPTPDPDALIGAGRRAPRRGSERSFWLAAAAGLAAVAVIAAVVMLLQPQRPDINRQYETLTSSGSASEIDLVVQLRFAEPNNEAQHRQALLQMGGSDIAATGIPGEYRMTLRNQPASLEHINSTADVLRAQPGVDSAEIVALQVPMK